MNADPGDKPETDNTDNIIVTEGRVKAYDDLWFPQKCFKHLSVFPALLWLSSTLPEIKTAQGQGVFW